MRALNEIKETELYKLLDHFLNEKFREIAITLPARVKSDCASFGCGYGLGYKRALLDIDNLLDDYYDDV